MLKKWVGTASRVGYSIKYDKILNFFLNFFMSLMKNKDREPNPGPEFMDPDPGSGKQFMNPASGKQLIPEKLMEKY
jgi:hypothetical protein